MLTIFKWVGIPNELKYGLQGGEQCGNIITYLLTNKPFTLDIGYFKTVTLPDHMCF